MGNVVILKTRRPGTTRDGTPQTGHLPKPLCFPVDFNDFHRSIREIREKVRRERVRCWSNVVVFANDLGE